MKKKKSLEFLYFIGIFSIFLFFRLWQINKFQYWSDDEQLLWYTIRHIIIDKHPSLVAVNTALGISLGSIYHILISPWYSLTKFNPQLILLLGNLFSLASLIAIYKAGKMLNGKKTALIASFLYSASFIASLFDRRLWALTPNFLATTLSVIALFGIMEGRKKYIYLLLPAFVLPFNSDPSLIATLISSIIAIILIKIKLGRKYLTIFVGLFILLLSPLIIFEIRHNGQNIKSIKNLISRETLQTKKDAASPFLMEQFGYFARYAYSRPSKTSEIYFCYCQIKDSKNTLPAVLSLIAIVLFTLKSIKTKNKREVILAIFLSTYILGVYAFRTILSRNSEFFYSIVVSPIVFLILAKIISERGKLVIFILLSIFLGLNLHSLLNSELKYPLKEKLKLTEIILKRINTNEEFSFYYSGDIFLSGGGWTSLLTLKGITPAQGSLSKYWGHAYQSYDLYPKKFSQEDPAKIVILSENNVYGRLTNTSIEKSDNIYATIIDNRKKLFNSERDVEKLYIPKYFY